MMALRERLVTSAIAAGKEVSDGPNWNRSPDQRSPEEHAAMRRYDEASALVALFDATVVDFDMWRQRAEAAEDEVRMLRAQMYTVAP